MKTSTVDYGAIRRNHSFNVPVLGVRLSDIVLALSKDSWYRTSGYLVDGRGLYHTDRRYSNATGIKFVGNIPQASVYTINETETQIKEAVGKRQKKSKRLTARDYKLNLIVRSIRGQILNPVLRVDVFAKFHKIVERMRSIAIGSNRRFMKMAANPINISYLTNWLIFG